MNHNSEPTTNAGPVRIILGASKTQQEGWVSTEKSDLNLLSIEDWERLCKRGTIDSLLAEMVWVYFDEQEAKLAAKHCFDFLKPGGSLRVCVSDAYFPDQNYVNYVVPGGTDPGSHLYKSCSAMTYISMRALFEDVGFEVDLLEYFDEQGRFHFRNWDPKDGMVRRTRRYDKRNSRDCIGYTALLIDARKPILENVRVKFPSNV